MPDVAGILNATGIFAGVLGLLFSSWISDIDRVNSVSIPRHAADRKGVIRDIATTALTKALPITLMLFGFLYVSFPLYVAILSNSQLYTPFENLSELDIEASLFSIMFLTLAHFFFLSVISSVRLVLRWRTACEKSERNQPHVETLG